MTHGALTLERPSGMSTDLTRGYRTGVALTTAGTIVVSFEGLLVRLINADSWTVIFCRGLLLGLAMVLFTVATGRKLGLKRLGAPAWIAILCYAGNVLFFICAINATTVANTLVIASAAPLFAAALGWAILRERPNRETTIAVIVAFLGLAIIFSGSLSTAGLFGDVLALGYAISLAAFFIALQRCSESQVPAIVALGGLLSALLAWPLIPRFDIPADGLWALLLLGIIVVPAATLLLSWGPQLIPASHVTLVMLLEIGLGPLWVWMVFSEAPAPATFLGGALVLITVIAHSWLIAAKQARAAARTS